MAVTATPVFVQTPIMGVQNFTTADSALTYKTVYAGGTNGSKVVGVNITTNDTTVGHVVTLAVTRNTTNYVLGIADVTTTGQGTQTGTVAVNGFAGMSLPVDNDGQKYVFLQSTLDTLRATFATAITLAGARIDVVAIGADF